MLALLMGVFFLCSGTPGLKGLTTNKNYSERYKRKVERRAGAAAPFFFGAIWVNHNVRMPISKRFVKLQSLFRISQSWGLYGGGPNPVRHLVIEIDGQRMYRTNDSELTWLSRALDHRKIRPMPETMSMKLRAFNWTGFSRFVLEQAHKDFPDAQEVTILSEWQKRDPGAEPWIHHGRRAQAPDWNWVLLGQHGVVLAADEQGKGDEADPGSQEDQ